MEPPTPLPPLLSSHFHLNSAKAGLSLPHSASLHFTSLWIPAKKKKEERKRAKLALISPSVLFAFPAKSWSDGWYTSAASRPWKPGHRQAWSREEVGIGEGEGPPRSAFLGAPGTPPACSRPGPAVSRARVPLPLGFPGLSDSPEGLPCPGCPQLSSRCWEASLDPGHFSLAVF